MIACAALVIDYILVLGMFLDSSKIVW